MSTKLKFAAAVATGVVALVSALPWADIVSAQTAAMIVGGAASVAAVLAALKIGTPTETKKAE